MEVLLASSKASNTIQTLALKPIPEPTTSVGATSGQPSGTLQLTIQSMDDVDEFQDCESEYDDWSEDIETGVDVATHWFSDMNFVNEDVSVHNDDDSSFVSCESNFDSCESVFEDDNEEKILIESFYQKFSHFFRFHVTYPG